MSDEYADLIKEWARDARQTAQSALDVLDAKPTTWRGSPIYERDVSEARAALVRIRNAASEVLRVTGER